MVALTSALRDRWVRTRALYSASFCRLRADGSATPVFCGDFLHDLDLEITLGNQLLQPRILGLEGIVSKRKGSSYRSGRSPDWLKMKNSDAPAVRREAEEEWGKKTGL